MHSVVSGWIVFSAACTLLGWFLSAVRQLNGWIYGLAFFAGVIVLLVRSARHHPGAHLRKLSRRFQRAVPLCFLVLLGLAFLGGALYSPKNWDTLAYRTPRVLHWLAEGGWHWIHTTDFRMNTVAVGYEWLSAPLIALTKNDRLLFLINVFSYALLPGLTFSFFTRVGIRPRVAWWWMWILPAGYCYAMQAGSTANDCFAAVYTLAALDFGLRARETKRASDLWLSMISVALLTGTKQTNLPLLLPWLLCVWPSLRLLWRAPLRSALVALIAMAVSAGPITVFNVLYAGTWKGWPRGQDFSPESPFWGLVGNTFTLLVQNFFPAIFPFANSWNGLMTRFVETTSLGVHFANFESFGHVGRAMTEQSSGLGMTVCLLVLVAACAGKWTRTKAAPSSQTWHLRLIRWSPWISLLVFMAVQGTYQSARYLASHYPLLVPLFLIRQTETVRRRWFRWCAILVMVCSMALVVISRYRPLFPVQTLTTMLEQRFPNAGFVDQFVRSYAFIQQLNELTPLHRAIPPAEQVVGYATTHWNIHGSIHEVPLWRPFGQRRVRRILPEDSATTLRSHGVRYVLLDTSELSGRGDFNLQSWLERFDAVLVAEEPVIPHPERPPVSHYLIRLRDASPGK